LIQPEGCIQTNRLPQRQLKTFHSQIEPIDLQMAWPLQTSILEYRTIMIQHHFIDLDRPWTIRRCRCGGRRLLSGHPLRRSRYGKQLPVIQHPALIDPGLEARPG